MRRRQYTPASAAATRRKEAKWSEALSAPGRGTGAAWSAQTQASPLSLRRTVLPACSAMRGVARRAAARTTAPQPMRSGNRFGQPVRLYRLEFGRHRPANALRSSCAVRARLASAPCSARSSPSRWRSLAASMTQSPCLGRAWFPNPTPLCRRVARARRSSTTCVVARLTRGPVGRGGCPHRHALARWLTSGLARRRFRRR